MNTADKFATRVITFGGKAAQRQRTSVRKFSRFPLFFWSSFLLAELVLTLELANNESGRGCVSCRLLFGNRNKLFGFPDQVALIKQLNFITQFEYNFRFYR